MSRNPLHSVSVAGIVFDDAGQVLLIKRRDNGQWQAPGGVLELDESFENGVAREVFEETRVCVHVDSLTGVYKNISRSVVALVFRCSVVGGSPEPTEEASEVAWVSVENAVARMVPAFAVRVVDASDTSRTGTAVRHHNGVTLL